MPDRQRSWTCLLIAMLVVLVSVDRTAEAQTLRTYFIGNSVTDTIKYTGLQHMAESQGAAMPWGRHMIPGAPLDWIWTHPGDGFQQSPYGYYPNALPNYAWDVLSLQPFDRHITGADGDKQRCTDYINLALQNTANKDMQVYIYSRWPRRDSNGSLFHCVA